MFADHSRYREAVFAACGKVHSDARFNTSLDLLREIEQVVDTLSRIRQDNDLLARACQEIRDAVAAGKWNVEIDPDGAAQACCERAEESLREFVATLERDRQAAVQTGSFEGDHEEAVLDAYDEALVSTKRLHNAVTEMRWAIMERDAEAAGPVGEFPSVDSMIRSLDEG